MKKLIYLFGIIFIFSCEKEDNCIKCEIIKTAPQVCMIQDTLLCGDAIQYTDGVLVKPVIDKGLWDNVEVKCY